MKKQERLINLILKENIEFEVVDGKNVVKGLKPEDFIIKDGKKVISNHVRDLGNNTFEITLKTQ